MRQSSETAALMTHYREGAQLVVNDSTTDFYHDAIYVTRPRFQLLEQEIHKPDGASAQHTSIF
ncbi:uncharacterized protein PHALS_03816 [Plasmopara halstedii]|uniref:Uncharacterized protein n=1 Tax=Plasmopara halstedii TaxID=4781 RepID=A0A0P1AXI7_PLAHL|nr:uncharacterized protein PHALS_03816 [Plasmopara halstedii]CEG47167.1 hypothetical protein PHALS_03816 [Plasmopara halstedii]|eukprot:XP_024583536.1 hypothetical protein PHALS_03816 [Plasmopara halstedii]